MGECPPSKRLRQLVREVREELESRTDVRGFKIMGLRYKGWLLLSRKWAATAVPVALKRRSDGIDGVRWNSFRVRPRVGGSL